MAARLLETVCVEVDTGLAAMIVAVTVSYDELDL